MTNEPKYIGPELDAQGKSRTTPKTEDRWKNTRLFKWFARVVEVEPSLVNMPKSQSCPTCRSHSKRVDKTTNGADYYCRNHGKFFVRAYTKE